MGLWQRNTSSSGTQNTTFDIFTYGLDTPAIAAHTGTARYNGVAYGAAFTSATGAAYDVTGTSAFNVDFSHATCSGTLSSGTVTAANLTQGGSNVGTINPGFFGPAGEENCGPFQVYMPIGQAGKSMTIAGVAVAIACPVMGGPSQCQSARGDKAVLSVKPLLA